MVKTILQIGNPLLTTKTKPVTDFSGEETHEIIRDLLDTCMVNADISAGLAAPQIGYDKAICLCRRTDLEEKSPDKEIPSEKLWEILINPEVVSASQEESIEWEGCLSIGVGDDNLWGPVARPIKVKVNYQSPQGEQRTIEGYGYFAHILQHEIDHLNGVLFITYIDNPHNIWKLSKVNEYVDKHGEYPDIE